MPYYLTLQSKVFSLLELQLPVETILKTLAFNNKRSKYLLENHFLKEKEFFQL